MITEIVQCGTNMYAVGRFTSIMQEQVAYPRDNILSFSANPPYTITSWAPDVNGTINTIAFDGNNCAHAYIGGQFTSINGTSVNNLAEIGTAGNVVPTFGSGCGRRCGEHAGRGAGPPGCRALTRATVT